MGVRKARHRRFQCPKQSWLIAAGQATADPEQLPVGVRALIDAADQILVIAPTLPGRFEWLASATDKAREQPRRRPPPWHMLSFATT